MNFYALIIGLAVVVYIIVRFKKRGWEKSKRAYPLFLASFPFFYFVFALYAADISTLGKEFLIGITFFLIAYIAYISRRKVLYALVGIGCILHGVYDYYHDFFFVNEGTPEWWLEFCGSIDFVLGIYLIFLSLTSSNELPKQNAQTLHTS